MKQTSVKKKATIKCDRCSNLFEITVYPILNISEYPALKRKLIDTSLFVQKCPKCHGAIPVPYSMVYSDTKNSLIVNMACSVQEYTDAVNMQKGNDMWAGMMNAINQEGEVRIVRTPMELSEKICIRESHYDDRVMELMKYHLILRLNENGQNVQSIFFSKEGKKGYFAVLKKNGETGTMRFEESWYQEAAAAYAQAVKGCKDIVVDAKWAKSRLHPVEIEEGEAVSIQ